MTVTATRVALPPQAARLLAGRFGSRAAWVAGGGLVLLLGASVLMRVAAVGHPLTPSLADTLAAPSLGHPFGTDALGRDVFARSIYAAVPDLQIAVIASGIPAVLGVLIAVLAGYRPGWADAAVVRVVDFLLAFPLMVLVICVVAIIGPGLTGVYLALVVKGLPGYIRLARGQMLVLREQQFVLAAETLALPRRRILVGHCLPHVVRPILVYAIFDITGNILLLASLSYLGLGVQPPGAEWGAIMADGQAYLLQAWWIVVLPGLVVVLVGVAISVLGEALAERMRLGGAIQ